MARVTPHPLLTGISGKSGGLVFRQVGNKLVVAQSPQPTERAPSEQQAARQELFRAARIYAKTVLADPYQRRAYEARAKTAARRADQMLISDFLNPPQIELLEAGDYHGVPGTVIRVLAHDDLEVAAVDITIATAAGVQVEQGAAALVHGVWLYTATAVAPSGVPLTITAIAKDRPGHEARASVVWA